MHASSLASAWLLLLLSHMPMLSAYTRPEQRQTHPLLAVSIISVITLFAAVPTMVHAESPEVYVSAASTVVPADGTQEAPFTSLDQALAAVSEGGTVHVDASGAYDVSSTLLLNKADVTIEGTGNPVIRVSGGSNAFTISASGVTLRGFSIQKTDKTTQTIIQIAASGITIANNSFQGQFVIGDAEVSRAMVIQGGLTGLTIENNTFSDLRQPAYISGVTEGVISGNTTVRTKGWVVEGGTMDFQGNTWGEGANANVYDIALLSLIGSSYYTDVPALSAANANAFIEDQRTSPATLSVVYVDENAASSGDGTARSPKKTIAEAISRVATGGTIVLASDITSTAQIDITKALTLDGAGHTIRAAFNGGSVINITASNVALKSLIEDGGTSSASPTTGNRGINIYKATGVVLDTVTASNNSKNGIVVNGSVVTAHNITTKGNGWEGIDVDLGSGVTTPAELTITGASQHDESRAAIRIDDTRKAVSVIDVQNQYGATDTGTVRDYYFNAKKVVVATPVQDTVAVGDVTITAELPANTTVTGSVGWDGVVNAPVATSVSIEIPGFTATPLISIAVGSNNSDLTFDKAAKLTFVGQAGQSVGWTNHAGVFTQITTICTDNTQATNDGLAVGADCKIDEGGDLIVWTKHFSTFSTYRAIENRNGGGGSSAVTTTSTTAAATTQTVAPAAATTGRVLGVETFSFTRDLHIGSVGDDVKELQSVLIAEGFLAITAPTGTFGELTRAAVRKYQSAHTIPSTGYVGSLTRAALNAVPSATTLNVSALEQIVVLLKQVLELQTKLSSLSQ